MLVVRAPEPGSCWGLRQSFSKTQARWSTQASLEFLLTLTCLVSQRLTGSLINTGISGVPLNPYMPGVSETHRLADQHRHLGSSSQPLHAWCLRDSQARWSTQASPEFLLTLTCLVSQRLTGSLINTGISRVPLNPYMPGVSETHRLADQHRHLRSSS